MPFYISRKALTAVFRVSLFLLSVVLGTGPASAQEHEAWIDSIYGVMKADLERFAAHQSVYHAANDVYALSLGLLEFNPSESVTLSLNVSPTGYSAVAFHDNLGPSYGCAAFYGTMPAPIFPVEPKRIGEISCTDGGPENPLPSLPTGTPEDPEFTPYTVPPEVLNREEVGRAMARAYPPLLRDAGIGGTVRVWVLADTEGNVRRTVLSQSSGHRALDDAALRVVATIKFSPALDGDEPVAVWISYPVTFRTRRSPP